MKKMPLKKLFHIDREDYKSEYEKRFNDDDTVHLDIEISGNAAFLCQTKEMFSSIISIERTNTKLSKWAPSFRKKHLYNTVPVVLQMRLFSQTT